MTRLEQLAGGGTRGQPVERRPPPPGAAPAEAGVPHLEQVRDGDDGRALVGADLVGPDAVLLHEDGGVRRQPAGRQQGRPRIVARAA